MLIAPKRLKVQTSNLAGMFPGIVPTWPLTNVSKKWAWSRSCDPIHFWALNANSSKTAEDTNFKFGRRVCRDSPDVTPDKSFQKVGLARVTWPPVIFWALNANSSKTAKGTNFKFDRHVPGIVATWPPTKVSEMLVWPGSRDHDNSTVQTAAIGQIPRSTERILVFYQLHFAACCHYWIKLYTYMKCTHTVVSLDLKCA